MDARREPRFSIYGAVKVTLLSSPERQIDCVLLDISATGLKLISPERIAADEIISIEAEDHLALADVRYAQPRGDKFTIGCERIHVLNKVSLPDEKEKIDQIKLLIHHYRNRISTGISTPRPDSNEIETARLDHQIREKCGQTESAPPDQPPAADPKPTSEPVDAAATTAFSSREQLLDAAAAMVVGQWDKIAASPHDHPASRSEIVDRLTLHLAEKLRPPTPAPPAPSETKKSSPPPPEKARPKINVRRWRLPLGLAAAGILGWGLSAIFWSLGSSGAAKRIPTSIAALISPKEATPAPTPSAPHAKIRITEPTSVMATVDGKRLFNKKFDKDDIREFEFTDKAVLRISNAKGAEISLDGKPIGSIGGRSQPRVVELSATGFRLLPVN
jgi:hypothetical protein